ncbi:MULTISPECIES: ABC transporter permease [Frankiaceae]|uniref:Transport permease protein n=2 Tax=Candidatus Protofrankia datiscae TaxID=2716812 RepID=F8B5J0_9ACTN|nr:ABC-2 type transporter [Candidatus Protofrankia datiscae]
MTDTEVPIGGRSGKPARPVGSGSAAGVRQPLDLRPAPGAARRWNMLRAQTTIELKLTLRRGESLLLTLVIPVGLLLFFTAVDVLPTDGARSVDFLVPGILALAVMSTAFTGQAIATGFERSYGVLRRFGASPLPRSLLLAGKTLAVVAVELIQVAVLVAVGFALGWHPHGRPWWVALLLLVATVAFCGLGLLMAGTLRAEATLAAANGVYLLLLLVGGVIVPLSRLPGWLEAVGQALPTAAASDGLRAVLQDGAGLPVGDLLVLCAWAVGSLALAARTFRWE